MILMCGCEPQRGSSVLHLWTGPADLSDERVRRDRRHRSLPLPGIASPIWHESGTGGDSFPGGGILGLHCMRPGLRGVGGIGAQVLVGGSGVPAVGLGEVVLEFGVAELVDSPRLA
jgi:hypothetical protein